MRIEVLIGNDDPVVYPLNASKITIGTSESSDIILSADGVSRKHITILTEGDNYYVIDQGSTNGSFINEERLIPGRKTEFTSFFPLRLGDNVLISLISDEEGAERIEVPASFKEKTGLRENPLPKQSDRTTVISLKELNKVKTEKLVQNRDTKRSTKKGKQTTKKAAPKKKLNPVPYIALAILGAAAFYNFQMNKGPEPVAITKPVRLEKPVKTPEVKAPEEVSLLIKESDLLKKEEIMNALSTLKCTTDVETYLCNMFPHIPGEPYGVTQIKLDYIMIVDAQSILEQARSLAGDLSIEAMPEERAKHQLFIGNIAAYLYFIDAMEKFYPSATPQTQPDPQAAPAQTQPQEGISQAPVEPPPAPAVPEKLDVTNYKEMNFFIALTHKKEDQSLEVQYVVAIKPEVIEKLRNKITKAALAYVRADGMATFIPVKDLYIVY